MQRPYMRRRRPARATNRASKLDAFEHQEQLRRCTGPHSQREIVPRSSGDMAGRAGGARHGGVTQWSGAGTKPREVGVAVG